MTNFTKNMMIAAATLVVAAGVAGAQTIKAEVPFGFRVAGTTMPAGSYLWDANRSGAGTKVFQLFNADTHRSILTIPYSHDSGKSTDLATLTFECSGTDCALVQVAPGDGEAYRLHRPNLGRGENTRVAVIRAAIVRAR